MIQYRHGHRRERPCFDYRFQSHGQRILQRRQPVFLVPVDNQHEAEPGCLQIKRLEGIRQLVCRRRVTLQPGGHAKQQAIGELGADFVDKFIKTSSRCRLRAARLGL